MKQAHEDFVAEFDNDAIRIGAAVEIEFGNNRFNDHQVCTASSAKDESRGIENYIKADVVDFWAPSQAFNNKDHNTLKWLVCDAGAELEERDTGATYRCIDLDHIDDLELGWWSSVRSNSVTGVFSTPQWVKSEWFEEDGTTPSGRLVNKFRICFDEAYPNMKTYNVAYKNDLGEWVDYYDSPDTLGVDEYQVDIDFALPFTAYGMKLTVFSTYQPDDNARLSECNALFTETFTEADRLVGFDVSEVREQYEGERPIGTTAANSFDFELDNSELDFSIYGDSVYSPYLVENCRVTPYVTANGHSVKMGEFWTDDWNEDGGSVSVTVNCRDFSKFLQDAQEDSKKVWEDVDVTIPFIELLSYAGIRRDDMVIEADTTRKYPVVFIDDQAPWELFGELALAEGTIFNFNSEGKFTLKTSYVGKEHFLDTFNRDADVELLSGSSPTKAIDNTKYMTGDSSFSTIKCEDGMARTDSVSQFGVAALKIPYTELIQELRLRTAGDQDVTIFAGEQIGGAQGVSVFIDASSLECSMSIYGVPAATTSVPFANGTDYKLVVTGSSADFYADGNLMIHQELDAPLTAGRASGFKLASAVGDRTFVEQYRVLPVDESVMVFTGSSNIESGSTKSEVWTNEVVVKLSEFSKDGHGTMRLWGPDNPTILSYARLISNINSTATEISVEREVRQENGSLIDNGWPQYDGILFFPEFAGGKCVGGELVKYETRTEHKFKGCKRGYAGTTARSWSADSYIGEAREWDIQFDGAPALEVKQPFSTAIDTFSKEPGLSEQAYVVMFDHDAFTGKLIMANIAKYLTWLEGTGQSLQDFDDKKEDIELNFTTSVAGVVASGGENKQKVVRKLDDPTASDLERIRRFGRNKVEIASQWIQSREHAQAIADSFIEEYATPRLILNMPAVCAPVLELGDRVTIQSYENMAIENIDYHVVEIKSSYDGGLGVELTLRQAI